ncbi:MAG: superoxide dismutase [Phycisphaerae bacterium]|nr:MAG: superoxide dismutase [Planctomycetota bacterium]KAB2944843.1 MAG: superoxide dismutase [Phycisphaerae bacterium]MBE7456847.1 superoxide dismutase [Planctomycetia bacterium]MCK6464295.1 superoxide dismutase [Phycisphaerae bacterium]MCL4717887.1 superoxide dismutase [Phycisphaerae bacterium]
MSSPSRREVLGSLGALTAGGWISLDAQAIPTQEPQAVRPPKAYSLPELGYPYDALEPHIDAKTMELHHSKHHAAYVKGLNAALEKLAQTREGGNVDGVSDATNALSFHGSGHILHCVFWKNMKKNGGGEPKGAVAREIERDFGSFSRFQQHFNKASAGVQGSGWGILAYEPLSGRLLVFGAEKHQNQTVWGCIPLLALDVWEHAYYLKHQNNRGAYIEAFWNVIDWSDVGDRLEAARKLVS